MVCSLFTAVLIGVLAISNSMNTAGKDAVTKLQLTEQKKAQEINSVIQKIQQSVDTLSEVAMSSFDYDAFVKDKAYADTFRNIMQETKNAVEELEKHIGQIGSTVADINTMVEQSSDGISGIAEKSGSTQNLVEDGYEKLQECNRSVDVIKEFVAQFHLD